MLTPEANLILTAALTDERRPGGMQVSKQRDGRIGVWLPWSKVFDAPDGIGDSLAGALEDAAYKVRTR
ncbi:MAG: hypothetical protein JWQ87_5403 [Candidatus Sulfotelmatobacter sp.]|nr:hypothetical protein [Candidatus Sulfotelmatobacter sp.]